MASVPKCVFVSVRFFNTILVLLGALLVMLGPGVCRTIESQVNCTHVFWHIGFWSPDLMRRNRTKITVQYIIFSMSIVLFFLNGVFAVLTACTKFVVERKTLQVVFCVVLSTILIVSGAVEMWIGNFESQTLQQFYQNSTDVYESHTKTVVRGWIAASIIYFICFLVTIVDLVLVIFNRTEADATSSD